MGEPYPREQAQVFGDDAASYDRFRPAYPRKLLEQIVANATPGRPILEIGAGTGKATKALLALGHSVVALEPDRRMAARLAVNCPPARMRIEHVELEAAALGFETFDLAVAAQAWHWVDRSVAYDRVADALVPGGALALIWHHPQPTQGLFGESMQQLYRQLAPSITNPLPGHKAEDFNPEAEPAEATVRFGEWHRLEHRWRRRLNAATLVGWLCTSSDHRMLGVAQRAELMNGVTALVNEFGGEVVVAMSTVAHVGRRA